jgi:hypothetical protein
MEFRPLTDIEVGILRRLLAVNQPAYSGFADQISGLLAAPVSDWGTIALSAIEDGVLKQRQMHGALPYFGVMKDADGVPIQFVVLVDKNDRLCELEITKLDGSTIRGRIVPDMIAVKLRQPGMEI